MTAPVFHALVPGAAIERDWYPGRIPRNIEVGPDSVIDSSFCFKHYFATGPVGLRVGRSVTIWRTSLAAERGGIIEIGDYCYLSNASLVCSSRISIGSYVMLAGGVTVADSDFHPMDPAERLADSVAVSPIGDRRMRPLIEARPVIIEDDVWIGFNAVILKGVRIGAGAMIEPGAVVAHDVPPGATVSGNPARVVERVPK